MVRDLVKQQRTMILLFLTNGKQTTKQYGKILSNFTLGEVSELADERDLGLGF